MLRLKRTAYVHLTVHLTVTCIGNFFGIMLYDALFRLSALVGPAHRFLLRPFPALLFRWDCLVRRVLALLVFAWVQARPPVQQPGSKSLA